MKPRRNLFLGSFLVAFSMAQVAHAGILYWDGSDLVTSGAQGGAGTWNTNSTANWWNGAANVVWPALGGTDDDAVFGGNAGTVTITTATANDITFNTNGYTLSGGTLTLNGTTPTITNGAGIDATISSKISGSSGLTKAGDGILTLSGANDYTDVTTISAGILKAGNAAALGSSAQGTTVSSGATLDIGGQNLGAEVVTISGTGVGGNGAIINTGGSQTQAIRFLTLAGDATVGGPNRWDIRNNSTATLDLGGFTLTKTGAQYMGVVGTSVTNPGNIIINQGELNLSTSTSLGGNASNSVTVNNGGTLGMYQSTSAHAWTLNLNTGSTLRGENGSTSQNIWAGAVNVAGNVTLRAESTHNLTINGNITGTAEITKTGAGNLILNGTNSITSSALTITAGGIQINNSSALPGAATITTSGADSASLVLGNGVVVGSGRTITVAGNGIGATFGALSTASNNSGIAEWQGGVTIGATTGARIGTQAGNLQISGVIGENAANSELIFRNNLATSAIILTNNNTYSGSSQIASGRVQVATIGNSTANSPLGRNGTIRLGLTTVSSGTLVYTGSGETTDKVIDLSSSTGNVAIEQSGISGTLKFSSNFTATGAGAKTLTLQGSTAGIGDIAGAIVDNTTTNRTSITKAGTGTWVLSGTNTYTGGTTVNAGTLRLNYDTAAGGTNTSKLSDTTSALILGGGTIELSGGSHTEIVTSTTLTANTASQITRSSGSSVLRLNAVTRNTGSTLDFGAGSIAQIDTTNTNGVLGGWATVAGSNWAVNSTNAGDGLVTALASYTPSVAGTTAPGTTANVDFQASNTTAWNTQTINTLRFNTAAANTLTIASGQTLTIGANGILVTSTVDNNASTITGGTLTLPTAGGDLIIHQNNTANKLTIGSAIVNNTGTLAVLKTGAGVLELSGTNTYTGTTTIRGGTIIAGSNNAFTNRGGLAMTGSSIFDINGYNAAFTTLSSESTNVITNSSTGTGASNATAVGTPGGSGVYVDALTLSTAGQSIAARVTDGATRRTQVVINNATSSANFAGITNTTNSFSGGLVLAYTSGTGTRLRISSAITGTPLGTGPIIIGQAAIDRSQILIDSATGVTLANDIFVNTALGSDAIGAFRVDTTGHTLSGRITANLGAARFAVGGSGAASVNLTGQVTGSNGLILDMGATGNSLTVTLNNGTASINNYQGDTIINQGAAAGRSATLRLGAANQIPNGTSAGNVVINTATTGIGTLDLNGFSETINGLSGNGTVTSATAATLTVGDNNATGAANTFSGAITGSAALSKIGSGTLTLTGTNSYTGGTTVSNGTLALGHATDTLLDTSAVQVNGASAILDIAGNSDTVGAVNLVSGSITGTTGVLTGSSYAVESGNISARLAGAGAAMTKSTTGTVTLSGANTFTGDITVNEGTLAFATGLSLSGTPVINLGNTTGGAAATLQWVNNSLTTNNALVVRSGSGGTKTVLVNTSVTGSVASLELNDNLTKGNDGTFSVSGSTTINSAPRTITVSGGTSSTLTLNGTLSSSGNHGLTKSGDRTLRLNGNNVDYAGTITLSQGSLHVGHSNALGTGQFVNNTNTNTLTNVSGAAITLSNSSYSISSNLIFGGSASTNDINTGAGAFTLVGSQRILSVSSGVTATIGGAMTGDLRKDGSGTLALAGTSTALTGIRVTGGVLQFTGSTDSSTTLTMGHASTTGIGKFRLGSTAAAVDQTFSRLLTTGTEQSSQSIVGGNASVSTLTVNQSTDTTYAGALGGAGTNENNLALIKDGIGALTLTGTSNTYTGPTQVNGGTLVVNGNISTSSTTVNNGGTLAGSGTTGSVSVANGGTLAPGTSPGTLTVSGNLGLNDSSILAFEFDPFNTAIGGGVNDLVSISGNLTLNGLLNVTATSGSFAGVTSGSWRLFNYSGSLTDNTLAFDSMPALATGYNWSLDTSTTGQVNLVVIPEPRAALLGGIGMLLLLRRRRD